MTARQRRSLAAAAGTALLAAAAQAQEAPADDGEFTTLANISVKPAGCNLRKAKRVELEALAADPRQWTGQCIAVEGYWWRRALSVSAQEAEADLGTSSREVRWRRIGLYGKDKFLRSPPGGPQPRIAVGIVVLCEDLWENYSMVFGYCHYSLDGPALALSELRRPKSPSPPRRIR